MKAKQFGSRFVVRLDPGEEIVGSLMRFCKDNNITLGSVTGIGATNKATIGLFDVEAKEYHSKELIGDHEIAPLCGNITTKDGEVYLHLHINLSDAEHRSFGGHLNSATVSATCELIIEKMDGEAEREFNDEICLNLLKL